MKNDSLSTPVLEIGGTHVTAARVLGPEGGWQVEDGSLVRRELDAHASAEALLDALAKAAHELGGSHSGRWGVALPGPFDYHRGIALYEHVGKFDQLRGVDVGTQLARRLGHELRSMIFLNDADAFGIGEFAMGVAGNSRRAACITLGTGVGSCFLADGVPVKTGPDVPPDGSSYLLAYQGRPLEDTVSRRAIRSAYAAAIAGAAEQRVAVGQHGPGATRGTGAPDVHNIAEAARRGDAVAAAVLEHAFAAVGEAVGPYLHRFGAEMLVIGGSMAGSWDIVEPAIRRGLERAHPALGTLPINAAKRSEEAGLIGAAYWARRASVPRT
ncbi:glucokinase [Pseudarthrobacter sp. W1I19]|uniref:ROK family protein n=1 Tax=Pseudarthrobacter sp. W1I19 TaxID=3042288 RepID=UPI002781380B|nr:ROK family protein [Pseudarthrobacter sp. W1I19]MDQ0924706.1 glucokinase [Pseudarthrobacter sp. W1I19]